MYGAPSDPAVDQYGAPGNEVGNNHLPSSKLCHQDEAVSRLVLLTRQDTNQGLPLTREEDEAAQSLVFQTGLTVVGRAVRESLCKR